MEQKNTLLSDVQRQEKHARPGTNAHLSRALHFATLACKRLPPMQWMAKRRASFEIRIAYRSVLGRMPSKRDVVAVQDAGLSFDQLRLRLLGSPEFGRIIDGLGLGKGPAVPLDPTLPPVLVHLHIPKTGGTSLNEKLKQCYSKERRLSGNRSTCRSRLAKLSQSERKRLLCVFGHDSYGIDAFLPQNVRYLTCLRKPQDRIFSFYKYVKRRKMNPNHKLVRRHAPDFGSFLHLVADTPNLRKELDNGQVRCLSGFSFGPHMARPEMALLAARRHLFAENMTFGLMERFDDLLQACHAKGFINDAAPIFANIGPDYAGVDDEVASLSPEQHALLQSFTHYDDRLYNEAAKVLEYRKKNLIAV